MEAPLVDQSGPLADFVDKISAAEAVLHGSATHGATTTQDSMPPTTLRLVFNRSAQAAAKPICEQSITPRRSSLSDLRRHPDGSVTLDGHVVLPSHAERRAQLRR